MDKRPAQHPQLRLQEALKSCRRKGTLDAFLACIGLANELRIGDESIHAAWQEMGECILGSADPLALSDTLGIWLAKCSFASVRTTTQPHSCEASADTEPSVKKVKELVHDNFEVMDATHRRL